MSESRRVIQPNPDEPCQWCGATEHKQPIHCFEGKECPHCGGVHWGRLYCPYSETQIEKEKKVEGAASRQLPRYSCHKEVWALKIKGIIFDWEAASKDNRETDGSATITPEDEGYAPIKVDSAYVNKHLAGVPPYTIVGGYYVVYKDGYKSFSPAKAFEEGYTRV